jgi:hypothetical protein
VDAANARRAQRRTDAVVAQYLHELSERHQRPPVLRARSSRGDEHAPEAQEA